MSANTSDIGYINRKLSKLPDTELSAAVYCIDITTGDDDALAAWNRWIEDQVQRNVAVTFRECAEFLAEYVSNRKKEEKLHEQR